MSSGPGESSGAGDLDLNCDIVAVLDNHEAGVEGGLEDGPVSTGGELLDKGRVETMDVGGNEKKECDKVIAYCEDGIMGNGKGSALAELGGRNEAGVVDTVRMEAGVDSHGGKLLEVEFGEKRSAELVFVSAVSFEDVDASCQTTKLGDGSDGNQKRNNDVDMEGVMEIYEISSAVLVGGGTEDERLEGSSILGREQVEIQVDLADGSGNLIDGQLNNEERESEGESLTVKLLEVETGEKEIIDLVTVSAERFKAVDRSLENVSSGDQKQKIDVDAEGMVIDHQFDPGKREAEVMPHSGKLLGVKIEVGSAELFVVSTEGVEPLEANIHTFDFYDGSGGHQKRGTGLNADLDQAEKGRSAELVDASTVVFEAVEVSGQAIYVGDGSDDDQNQGTDATKEDFVANDEDFLSVLVCSGGAEGESLEGSSHFREDQDEVNLVDGGVQVVDDQLSPEEKEAESDSLGIKLLEDAGVRQITDLVAVTVELFEAVEARNQPMIEMDTGKNYCADLVAVSEEFVSVKTSNQPVDLGDGSGGDQKQGIDLDADDMVVDGKLWLGERDAEVKSLRGEFMEVDKGGEGSVTLLSVSSIEISRHRMDFHDGYGGDQKQVTDLYAEVMVIDGALGSGRREGEVETPGGKLLEMDDVEKGSTVLVYGSNERIVHAEICKQTMDLCAGSGYDQILEADLDAEGMVEISENSAAVSVGSGLLEAEHDKATGQAINLLLGSGYDQRLVTDVDAEGIVRINEDSVSISIDSGGPEDENSGLSVDLRKELAEMQGDLHDERGQITDGEADTIKRKAECKPCIGMSMEVDLVEKGSAKLFGASAELSEAAEASSEAVNLGDGYVGEQKRCADVDTEVLMGTDEASLTVLIGGETDDEKMERSSILRREQIEVLVDFVEGRDQAVGCQSGCGERDAAVNSYEGMPLELHIVEKESADLVAVSAEEFETIMASNHAMSSGGSSGSDQSQGIDADAECVDWDAQLGPGEINTEVVKSHRRKLLEVNKREKESAEPFAVLTEIFEPLEANSQATEFVDGSDGDQKQKTDVNVEGMAIYTELSPRKGVAEVEYHGEKVVEVGTDNENSAELPFVSTEGLLPCKGSNEAMKFVDGCGSDQLLETDVGLDAMVRTDEDSVIANGAPEDTGLEGSLTLRKGHVEVQGKLADGIGEVVEGKLGTAISLVALKSYGESCIEVGIGENGTTELVAATTKLPEVVEGSNQGMDFGDGSGSDQIQGTDAYAKGMLGDEAVTILVVGEAQGNEILKGSSTLGEEQVEVLVHSVDEYHQVESNLESHGGRLLDVELGEKRKEFIAVSAERLEAVEINCQAMDLGDSSGGDQMEVIDVNTVGMINISDDSAAVSAGRGPDNARLEGLEEEPSVLGIEHVEALQKFVDGCGHVADSELIHEVSTPIVDSNGGKLLKVETGVKRGAEPFVNSAEGGLEAVGTCNSAMDLEHAYIDAEYVVGNVVDSLNVSGADGGPEDKSMEKSLLLRKDYTDVIQDLVDGHDQALDGKGEAEVEPRSEKLLKLDVREKVSSELASVAAGGSCAFEGSRQDMNLEVRYPTEQKQETNLVAACMVGIDEDSVVIVVDGGGTEDEMLKGSSKLVKDVEVGEETNGTGSTVKDFSESTNNQVAGYEIMMHTAQVQTEFGDDQSQGTCFSAQTMVGGTEQASLSFSVGCGSPEDEKLDNSYRVGEKQVDFRDDYTGSGTPEKKLAYPEKIPEKIKRDGVDAMIDTGRPEDLVHIKRVEDLDLREGLGGNHWLESCIETDAEPLVVAVAYQGTEAQGLKAVPRSDGVLVEVKHGIDESQVVEKIAPSQKSGESVNVDVVCNLVEGHPHEMDGGIVVDNDHNQSEVYSEFSAGEENMIEKGLACLHACVEIVHDFRDHDIDDRDSGIDGNDQETAVTYNDQGNSLGTFQGSAMEILKGSEKQSEGCDGTTTESTSVSQQATYYLSFSEKEGFSTSDLVWGKVKSHPWWPGQIFDFSGASQLAIKYHKKDHFLVAYFGDKTFAWCEESRLKPFLLCFSQMEMQTSSDSFVRALSDILVEISRRVELSMTCLCVPVEAYTDITYQRVENAGVRGKIVNSVFDRCEVVNYFHPDQLLEYVKELAQLPTGGADRLQLTVAQSQLKAIYLSKGFTELPAFTNGSGLIENDFENPSSISEKLNEDDLEHSATLSDLFSTKGKLRGRDGTLCKQKHIVEDGRKQKSLSELIEEETTFLLVNKYEHGSEEQDEENCLSFGNKRKALGNVSTDIGRSKTMKIDYQADDETKLQSPTSISSFKVGEFISRAASKLTSGQPIRKCHGETSDRTLSKTDDWSIDYMDLDDFFDVPFDYPKLQIDISVNYPPTNEMLAKLCLAARNPMKGHNFSSIVINFFCTFRNVQVSNISIKKSQTEKPRAKRGRKKKIILDLESLDMSTPDHMKDSYWSDMIIPEKDSQLNLFKRRGRKKRKFIDESPPLLMLNSLSDCEPKLHTGTMCPHVKHILTAERPIISVEEKIVDERTPTAVILYFNSSNSLPSDMDLIRIFSRYGPLKEEETYIERKNNSAMVVFKKRTDAEMAFSSAGKFSTFGPALLSYRLKHFPSKSSPVSTMIAEVDATPINDGRIGNLAEPEFNGALDGKLCEAVDKESSIFVQCQEHFEPLLDMLPGKYSELAQYQVGDVEVSESTPARKEPSQDVPAQMETCAVSDHLLLESLDQEFSYFDLDQAEVGDVSGTENGGEKSSGLLLETREVSHAANERSLVEESSDPLTCVENGTMLKTTTQHEAVDLEFSCSTQPAEPNDTLDELSIAPDQSGEEECSDSPPTQVGAGSSDQSSVTADVQLMEADTCATVAQAVEPISNAELRVITTLSDSTQTELEKQAPSVSGTSVEATGMPSNVTEVCFTTD